MFLLRSRLFNHQHPGLVKPRVGKVEYFKNIFICIIHDVYVQMLIASKHAKKNLDKLFEFFEKIYDKFNDIWNDLKEDTNKYLEKIMEKCEETYAEICKSIFIFMGEFLWNVVVKYLIMRIVLLDPYEKFEYIIDLLFEDYMYEAAYSEKLSRSAVLPSQEFDQPSLEFDQQSFSSEIKISSKPPMSRQSSKDEDTFNAPMIEIYAQSIEVGNINSNEYGVIGPQDINVEEQQN